MAFVESANPATREIVARFECLSEAQLDDKIERSIRCFASFRRTALSERAAWLARAADLLEADRERLGQLMTREMGKPLKAAVAEVAKCALACRYYVEHAAELLADRPIPTDAALSVIRMQPLGPVLAIMPWNFPFWQVFRFAAPALMAGNTALLKHASNVPACALAIEELFQRTGLPRDAFQTLLIGADKVPRLLQDRRVAAATLTGSVGAGRSVASLAGQHLKKTVLELGGSDPFVVMPSADLDQAVKSAIDARIVNSGQSCIAAKRFILAGDIAEEFCVRFVERMRGLRVGDPLDPDTDVGPLATAQVLEEVEEQVRRSVQAGARCLAGGHRLQGQGLYYAPTVLDEVPDDSPAAQDEIFGPVAALFRAADAADAVRICNRTRFGLGASVWSRDAQEQELFANEIEAGMVFVNHMVASDPRLPFGGIKDSGYGRELGPLGILEFVNAKTVVVHRAP